MVVVCVGLVTVCMPMCISQRRLCMCVCLLVVAECLLCQSVAAMYVYLGYVCACVDCVFVLI